MKIHVFHAALLAIGICATNIGHAQASGQIIFLGQGTAAGINDSGLVVGTSSQGATIWNGSSTVVISNSLGASGVNNAGQIVGQILGSSQRGQAALWSGPALTLTSLNTPYTYATAINAAGQIVGNGENTAFLWNGSSATNLAVVNNGWSTASAINNAGEAVGNVNYAGDVYTQLNGFTTSVAAAWKGTNLTLLNSLGGNYSDAYAINNAGVIVGVSTPASNVGEIATEWNGTTATALGSLGGNQSYAYAINNAGVVVGASTNAADVTLATLWKGTTAINLNTLLNPALAQAGWVLQSARGINNEGWIVGDAYNHLTGREDAFELQIMSPVPEPDSWLMLLTGLGLIGALRYFKSTLFRGRVTQRVLSALARFLALAPARPI